MEETEAFDAAAGGGGSLLSIADRVTAGGGEPMAMADINEEVKAARAERRRRAGGEHAGL